MKLNSNSVSAPAIIVLSFFAVKPSLTHSSLVNALAEETIPTFPDHNAEDPGSRFLVTLGTEGVIGQKAVRGSGILQLEIFSVAAVQIKAALHTKLETWVGRFSA